MRILIVEDDHKIANAIKKGLQQENFAVDISYEAKDGIGQATTQEYDLIILDRMLPGIEDGLYICKVLREQKNHTPVLILTAKDEISCRVEGLNCGADDYLVKPFAFEELLARIKALLRRPYNNVGQIINIADLKIDTQNYAVIRSGQEIKLSSKEYALLEYMARNAGRILTKDNITAHVWDYDADILPNTVEVYIGYLRNKIDRPFKNKPELIQTVRGFGYKLQEIK